MTRLQYHRLRVAEVIEETPDARSIVLDVPAELKDAFRFRPGQHLQLHVPCAAKPVPRCYSLSGVPGEPLRVTVKRMGSGPASNWLCSRLQAGDVLDVAVPAGAFVPKSFEGDFLLFAGGSGITPVMSILRSALAHGEGRVRLFYANRDEASIIFRRALDQLAAAHPRRLDVIHWLDSAQGVPSPSELAQQVQGLDRPQCFVCGPGPFMDAAATALKRAGIPHAQIHVERFVSLPDDADEGAVAAPAPGDGGEVHIEVELDGQLHRVKGVRGQLLLEALEDAGLAPPYSCRAGACAACMCRIEDGEVELVHNHVLDQKDLEEHWILSCQAVMHSERIVVRYPS
ncbi:MAG TPA: ferredoxin--NADP reductase [Candidatus Binatia bacterium]|nr:ferredoxin--NADP reductase [Candidatus Binatia bacterium]